MILHRNPEFARNAWLELTPQRLLAMPVLVGMLLLLGGLSNVPGLTLKNTALMLFVLIVALWGAKLASDSMSEELSQGTWDSQRLSGLGAWSMTLGKLLGGPVFAWYGGALCLAAYLSCSLDSPLYPTLRTMLTAVGLSVTVHATVLLSSLMAWRKLPRSQPNARSSGLAVLFAFVLAPQALGVMLSEQGLGAVTWYGFEIPGADFALFCTALATFWSVLGLYRSMREELAFRDPPTAWVAFLLFVFFFIGGWCYSGTESASVLFVPIRGAATVHLGICAGFALYMTYGLLLGERKDWVKLRRILALSQLGEARRAWELVPKWMATFALTAVIVVMFAIAALITESVLEGIALACAATGMLAFLVRDGALVLGLNFTRDQRRADAAAALYLAVLYAILPALMFAFGVPLLAGLFWPHLIYEQPMWIAFALLQGAAALDFARRRWEVLPTAESD